MKLDEDNDGLLDDCDQDGIPDYLDPDVCGLTIPDVFTPNNDGKNDFFVIKGIEQFPGSEIKIFNRWGNIVYQKSDGYKNDWDGTNQFGLTIGNRALPVGTYFYVLDKGNGSEVIKGYVYLSK